MPGPGLRAGIHPVRNRQSRRATKPEMRNGAGGEDRTPDLRFTKPLHYRCATPANTHCALRHKTKAARRASAATHYRCFTGVCRVSSPAEPRFPPGKREQVGPCNNCHAPPPRHSGRSEAESRNPASLLRNASALRCSAKSRGRALPLQAAKRPEKRDRAPGTFARRDARMCGAQINDWFPDSPSGFWNDEVGGWVGYVRPSPAGWSEAKTKKNGPAEPGQSGRTCHRRRGIGPSPAGNLCQRGISAGTASARRRPRSAR